MTNETDPNDDELIGMIDTLAMTSQSSNYKTRGKQDAPDGTGVLGYNTATNGAAHGVEGVTDSAGTDAAGVYGEATTGSGETTGVHGVTQSMDPNATGVKAEARSGSSVAIRARARNGGHGVDTSTDAQGNYALWARHVGSAGGSRDHAVRGETYTDADGAAGVSGTDGFAGTGATYGVKGETFSSVTGAAGVAGRATKGSGKTYGVYGETQSDDFDAAGVKALGTDTHGIHSETKGTESNGVYAIASNGSGWNYGVRAECNSTASPARGAYANLTNSSATGVAIEGEVNTTSASAAVRGDATGEVPAVEARGRLTASTSISGGPNSLTDHVAAVTNTEGSDGFNHVMALEMPNISGPAEGNNFLTFLDENGPIGAIEGSSGGVKLDTSSGDFAEYFPLADPEAEPEKGTVLGLESGELVADADDAEAALVVTRNAAITGKNPTAGEGSPDDHECVALLGQVPVKVAESVDAGDLLVAAGDGLARPASVDDPGSADAPVVGRALESTAETDAGSRTVEAFVGRSSATAPGQDEDVDQLRAELARKEETIERLEGRLDDLEAAVERLVAEEPRPASADD